MAEIVVSNSTWRQWRLIRIGLGVLSRRAPGLLSSLPLPLISFTIAPKSTTRQKEHNFHALYYPQGLNSIAPHQEPVQGGQHILLSTSKGGVSVGRRVWMDALAKAAPCALLATTRHHIIVGKMYAHQWSELGWDNGPAGSV